MTGRSSRRLSVDAQAEGLTRRPVTGPIGADGVNLVVDRAGVDWEFSGSFRVPQPWSEVLWPLFAMGAPATVALTAFWVTESGPVMIWTGTGAGIAAVVADYRRDTRQRRRDRAARAATAVVTVLPVLPVLPVAALDEVRRSGEAA